MVKLGRGPWHVAPAAGGSHSVKAMVTGGPPFEPPQTSRVAELTPFPEEEEYAGQGMKTSWRQRLERAVGSEDQVLPQKRSCSLSTPLLTWLGFKEANYFSALGIFQGPDPTLPTLHFPGGNKRPMRK